MASSETHGLALDAFPADVSIVLTPTSERVLAKGSEAKSAGVTRMVRFACCSASVLDAPRVVKRTQTRLLLSAGAPTIVPVSPLYWVALRP
jgi:hypothetical protein